MLITYALESLFDCSQTQWAYAHCVGADLTMGAGIAVMFKRKFGKVAILRRQNPKTGKTIFLNSGFPNTPICYLVTKEFSNSKPTLHNIEKTLINFKELCLQHKVTHVAMPTICCGIDGCIWSDIEALLQKIFKDTDITFKVCYLLGNKHILKGFLK